MTNDPQMSDAAIREKTGKTWPEWRETLDAWGAGEKPHDAIGLDDHLQAWTDEAARDSWLPAGTLALRTSQPGKSARFDDTPTGDIVALWFTDKGPGKSSVSLQIEKLPSREAADERKTLWKTRLADLAAFLKG